MLEQALVMLAAAGGTAVVQAASTDAWTELRQAVASWFGRNDTRREQLELERLDQTRTAVRTTDTADADRVLIEQQAAWRTRIEYALEGLSESERAQAADQLRAVLTEHERVTGVGQASAGSGGVAAGRDVNIRADGGSIAGGVINGGVHMSPPSLPDPSRG
ncbi:hypothetical protein HET69_25130 [Streptomyces sp. CJ_13]|uniref:hypothetical protein n=1 Tax=Streptomyces sp. CJ_13 TaxID=2724943 RepID=UPI001BDC9CFF|nr:hypothetical protein [Streptomyces sp. CJ_13]MBT1187189.1 hypothetical protein [Streptomyces sp. CJ_13]